jgi:hypothetical protein
MSRSKLSTVCLLTAVLAAAAISLRASDPVGVYAIVDRVVLQPNDVEPTSVQIWGVFSFAVSRGSNGVQPFPDGSFGNQASGDVYGPVQKGYVYYTCPAKMDARCQAEWADLKSSAGKHEVVAFGQRWEMTGRVRPATENPANPDGYTLNIGTMRMGSYGATGSPQLPQYAGMVAALQAASRAW